MGTEPNVSLTTADGHPYKEFPGLLLELLCHCNLDYVSDLNLWTADAGVQEA
jgi:hypothetical protein